MYGHRHDVRGITGKRGKKGMNPIVRTLFTLAIVQALFTAIYCFATGALLFGFIWSGVFSFELITAFQLTPTPPKICPHCGKNIHDKPDITNSEYLRVCSNRLEIEE
jgi:hypothetical protein